MIIHWDTDRSAKTPQVFLIPKQPFSLYLTGPIIISTYIESIMADVYLTLFLQSGVNLTEFLLADVAITESIEEDTNI